MSTLTGSPRYSAPALGGSLPGDAKPIYDSPPTGVFEDRRSADKPKLDRAQIELRNAKMLVRGLRSKCTLVLREIRKPLVARTIRRLRAIIESEASTAIEVVYAAEVINRLLLTATELSRHFGVDDFANVVEREQKGRRAFRQARESVRRQDERAEKHRKQAQELAQLTLEALGRSGASDAATKRRSDEGEAA